MASIFTKIINGEMPSYKIAEDENFLAFLDVFPLHEGHTLVIPKKEIDYIFDLDADRYQALWLFAQKVSHAVRKSVNCKRIGVAVIGLEVAHAHIHLVPINTVGDINFAKEKLKPTAAELEKMAEKIRGNF